MPVRDYRVRYGTTWYEHTEGDEAFPLPFLHELEAMDGRTVTFGNNAKKVIDPDDPDSSFTFLVDGLNSGRWPDEVDRLVDDSPPSSRLY